MQTGGTLYLNLEFGEDGEGLGDVGYGCGDGEIGRWRRCEGGIGRGRDGMGRRTGRI